MYLNQENGTDWVHHWSRWRERKTPFQAERTQIHHKLTTTYSAFLEKLSFKKQKFYFTLENIESIFWKYSKVLEPLRKDSKDINKPRICEKTFSFAINNVYTAFP